ncbi:MAG: peptidoglycan DD-metalloendopeptidase family protein [Propionibacteriales bacterium]|nr:peptidoglycan DD-metalloendopeptidase family protein [Propionibacteriales bacterium]
MVAAAGAISVGSAQATPSSDDGKQVAASIVGFGSDTKQVTKDGKATSTVIGSDGRGITISRSSGRQPIDDQNSVSQAEIEAAASQRAEARDAALAQLAELASERADELESKQWVLPMDSYRLTARYGQGGGLWAGDHTGLDFAAPYGTPIMSVGHGIVTSVGYDGSYGNKTVITHDDGTQTWYCHQASATVAAGEEVSAGDVIGYVGMTGNTTGPHLHLEVRPDPETPIDPYSALIERGVNP